MPPRPRDDGLSEVVGFVLILGMIVVALSLYQVYGVPAVGRENEIAHMNHVKDRFVDYKIALDSLWVNDMKGVLLSTSFDLGTGAPATAGTVYSLPILTPAGSGGTVEVKEGGAKLTIEPAGRDPVTIPLGSLAYRSSNNYWVDQTWTYQMGAVFLTQREGTTVRVAPSMSVSYDATTATTSIYITPMSITGSDSLVGSGPVRIETMLLNRTSDSELLGKSFPWVNISVDAGDKGYARAWERVFKETMRRGKIDYSLYDVSNGDSNVAYLHVRGSSSDENTPDVSLVVNRATYEVNIISAASLIE